MKKQRSIKSKFIFYVMSVAVLSVLLITLIMSVGSIKSANSILLDNLQITARISSQNISSNLHLFTERIYNLSEEDIFTDKSVSNAEKQQRLEEEKLEIEFVWLSAYDTLGEKMYGDENAPASISDTKYFSNLTQTGNLVIGEPYYDKDVLQFCVGAPIKSGDEVTGFLIGSYKYDVLNDILSLLILGNTGSAHIMNEEGIIIGDSDLENIKNKVNLFELSKSAKSQKIFHQILTHETGSSLIKIHGVSHYIGYAPIPGTNFSLMVDVPQRDYMDSVIIALALSILLGVVLVLCAAAVIFPVSSKISHSLGTAAKRLQALAEGNLSDEVIPSESDDETRILTDSLAETITCLNRSIQNIQSCLGSLSAGDYTIEIPDDFQGDFSSIRDSLCHITDSLNKTMLQMNHSSSEINRNSGEVSRYSGKLLEGSQRQSALLEQLRQSMEQITASIEKNKDNASQIEQCSQSANQKTELGADNMQDMLDTMNLIHGAVDEISKISQLIEDISRQTNLLSLNASIEAARAGEAGRGFAIVAGEIGQLSNQTTNALQQTAAIIKRSADIIQTGLENANQTAHAFREIQAVTTQYRDISAQLSDTVKEQTSSVAYVNEQLLALKEIADQNRSLAQETDQMADDSLAQSKELKDYVARVKIKESTTDN
ncbi:MAG: methyl-accepting chemotaxis protein [Lachnospiraceae bacterium]|nr:methyl-accepting chemotaxis protein [Lachnospiraceae bacterium]